MMQKPIIYYDNMMSPTYIRLVSDRLNLDHIVYTEANEQPIRYSDICRLAEAKIFIRYWSALAKPVVLAIPCISGIPEGACRLARKSVI